MSQDSIKKDVRTDEIDLLDLFRRMGRTVNRWLKGIGKGILITIVFIIRKWIPMLVSLIAGILISYYSWKTSPSYYTSDLVLRINIQPADEVISYINRLRIYGNENHLKYLATSLGMDESQIGNLRDINAYWIIDNGNDGIPDYVDYSNEANVYDTVNVRMHDRMDVRVRISKPQVLSEIRDGIINYLTSDPLFIERNRLRNKQNSEMLARLEYEIVQLDSLQKVKYFEETRKNKPESGGQMIFLQEQTTQLLHEDIYDIYLKKQELEQTNDLYRDIVTVINDFSIPEARDNGFTYYLKMYVPSILLITLFILVIFSNRRNLRDIYNKY